MNSPTNDPYFMAKAQIRAFSKGGKCLSTQCSGAYDMLSWRCQYGHQWQEQLGKVLRGKWCPACAHPQAGSSAVKFTSE